MTPFDLLALLSVFLVALAALGLAGDAIDRERHDARRRNQATRRR